MMTSSTARFFLCFFSLAVFAALPVHAADLQPSTYLPRSTITIQTKAGKDYTFDVEMALDEAQQEQGLMGRTYMNSDAGMLFLFDREDRRVFWMKNTLIPLDMIFIANDGTIRHIHHNAIPQDLTQITSEEPARAALEINGNLAGTLGIAEGDKVIHEVFRNTAGH